MAVVVNENNGAPGHWRWNVKRRRGTRWDTIASSDRTYLDEDAALQAAQAFATAERIWDRPDSVDDK